MTVSIEVKTSNCNQDIHYLVTELATASVTLEMKFDEIVSVQSRNQRKKELVDAIHGELSKFKWVIAGSVQIEFAWYLPDIERQETDKVGDIDNITKPILDAMTGIDGILIDDSQIGSLHTFWMSRNHQLDHSVLRLEVSFNNDETLEKKNLFFIQYHNAMSLAINVDLTNAMSVFGALIVVRARRWHRATASAIKALGEDVDRFMVASSWDFHRTRLSGFPRESVVSVRQFLTSAAAAGFSRSVARGLWRPFRKTLLGMRHVPKPGPRSRHPGDVPAAAE